MVASAARPIDVKFLELALVGAERATVGFGNSQSAVANTVVSLRARLLGPGRLPAGKSSYACEVPLPAGVPATYAGSRVRVTYELRVHAAIPWWPDARAVFEVKVGHAAPTAIANDPVIYSSAPAGPRAREGFMEVSVPTRAVAAGDVLRGVVALGNVEWNRYGALQLTLVGTERVLGKWATSSELARYQAELVLFSPVEGQAIPFTFVLPRTLPPTARTQIWALDWQFEVRAQVRFGKDVVVTFPLAVLPTTARAAGQAPAARFAPPTVGSERVQELWRSVGRAAGLELAGETLVGAAGDVRVVVRREHRGERGLYLVAELRYPRLELGLRREERLLRAAAITGREVRQVDAFVARIADALRRFALADLDDEHLVVELRDAGFNRARLVGFAEGALALAHDVDIARASMLPPALMTSAVAAWTELARELGGTLHAGAMTVRGRLDGHAVEIRTEWLAADRPDRTVVELVPRAPLTVPASGAPPLRDDARAIAERLAADARSFRLSADCLTVILPAPLTDVALAREALRRMSRLCALLRPTAGVYR